VTLLLERERELAELQALVGAARDGSGRFAVIEAQAGLGKTRLVQAARDVAAETELHVLAARATELERDFPFALVRQLFEPPLAGMPAAERNALFEGASGAARGALGFAADGGAAANGDHAADTFAVLHGLYWLTAALAERQPLLLAVDDAHWADAASLDYLAFLLPRLEELPVLLVLACRPDEAGAESALARIATDTLARRLTPAALSAAAAATLLEGELSERPEAAFAATCHEVSGGNPFLLCELARTLVAQAVRPAALETQRVLELAPERVTRTVLVRLARLSPDARAVARAVVVLGDDADSRLVAEFSALDADAVHRGADELRAAAILDGEPSLRFAHPLVRTALGADLPAGERAELHARAVTLLRERGADAQQLAAHLVATDARGERATVELLLEAGRRALANGAPRSAIAYLMRAWREPVPDDLRTPLLRILVTCCIRVLDFTPFEQLGANVYAELERDPQLLVSTAAELGPWVMYDERGTRLMSILERAVAIAVEAGDLDRALHIEGQMIGLARLPPEAGRARLAPYREHVSPDGPGARLLAAFDAAWGLFDGDAATSAALARTALHDALIFSEQSELLVLGEALHALLLADDLVAAQRVMDRALERAHERNALWEVMGALYLRAQVGLARGELAAAAADLHQAQSLMGLRSDPSGAPSVAGLDISIMLARGELEAAEAALEATGMSTSPLLEAMFLDPFQFARGRLRHAQGRNDEAAADLNALHERRTRNGTIRSPFLQAGAALARPLVALGERERAHEVAAADLLQARRWGAPVPLSRALRATALATVGPASLDALEQAVVVLSDSPALLERAHALHELGAALRRANRRAEARGPLREALALARGCGAVLLAKQAHDELAATGERVRRWTPIGVESLTPSERRVAEMAASGMTNRQIAQTLYLTVKTIETHLGAAYDKLGIRSRRELPDVLAGPAGRNRSAPVA
jgi:DNA-binding NarL/FixJ family response regulator